MVLHCGPQFSLARAFDMRSCYSADAYLSMRFNIPLTKNLWAAGPRA